MKNFLKTNRFRWTSIFLFCTLMVFVGLNVRAQLDFGGDYSPGGIVNGDDSAPETSAPDSSPGASDFVMDSLGGAGAQMAAVAAQAIDAGALATGASTISSATAPNFDLDASGTSEVDELGVSSLPGYISGGGTMIRAYDRAGKLKDQELIPSGWALQPVIDFHTNLGRIVTVTPMK